MASELLFDLSAIDLSQVAISPEEVGRLNPQCGDMRQLDHVIWYNDDRTRIIGSKTVRDDEFWVPYHIPGRPIYPGVLMIEAAAQLSSVIYLMTFESKSFLGFTRCDKVVFRAQVEPGRTLYLLTEIVTSSLRRVVTKTQGLVDGSLAFEATITGMVI